MLIVMTDEPKVQEFTLKEDNELRFEVGPSEDVVLELLQGRAEIFGTELEIHKKYAFPPSFYNKSQLVLILLNCISVGPTNVGKSTILHQPKSGGVETRSRQSRIISRSAAIHRANFYLWFFNVFLGCQVYFIQIVDNELCGLMHVNSEVAAVVSCSFMISNRKKVIYIQALGGDAFFSFLPYYREQGLGSQLLRFVESKAHEHNVSKIMLHVQVDNSLAIAFYNKRGFSIQETCLNYYKRSNPSDAYIMIKDI
uniref:N-terminal methionine N(alpha)-acetyltransferase NatE n=1 Tax=Heterorhabditis bacteriophora TaxID=37862 RepID=A0A1I7WUT2_HETBA